MSQTDANGGGAPPPPLDPSGLERATLLEARNLYKAFGGNVVVDDVSFTVEEHRIVGLIGPNGAGKTTVFNLLTGFILPDQGQIHFKGKAIDATAPHHIVSLGIARTFQELRLFESLSVRDNVVLAMKRQPGEQVVPLFFAWRKSNRHEQECRIRAEELLRFVGLGHVINAAASDLSYGQQKRLALARALAAEAELICLDEPAAGLDPEAVDGMVQLIQTLVQQSKTILLVEHNLEIVKQLCHKVIFMDQGRLVVEGSPETVLDDPRVLKGFMGI